MTPDDIITAWKKKDVSKYFPAPQNRGWWESAPKARDLAIALHKNQTRKDSELAYATHLGEVALVVSLFQEMGLLNEAEANIAFAAAWLHDSIEDQGLAKEAIAAAFGLDVATAVDALSKKEKSDQIQDPMTDSLHRINQAGRVAALIKFADRISNLSTSPPASWQPKKIKRYAQQARTIIATLSEKLPHQACLILESIASDYLTAHASGTKEARP